MQKTIVFVSHDLDEALKIGSKIGIMESAQIIQYDTPENIVLNPATAYVQDFVAHTNPLNVLKGHALMTPVSQLPGDEFGLHLDLKQAIRLQLDQGQQLLKVTQNTTELAMQYCSPEQDITLLSKQAITITPPDVGMRRAIEIKHHTGLPLILAEQEKVLGILNDDNFYHALLGKHFNTNFAPAAI